MAHVSLKHTLIDKANGMIVAVTAVAAFVLVFSLVASKTLIGQADYQDRVIAAKAQALAQLQNDVTASSKLVSAYQAFVGTPQNVIGGLASGTGPSDGDNAKIILDALPSKYDFPALAVSLGKIIASQNLQGSITGSDEQVAQQSNQSSANPTPVAMPFGVSLTGNYLAIQNVIQTFERSIRPFQFQTMQFSGDQSNLTLTATGRTFYQPEKTLTITTKVIK